MSNLVTTPVLQLAGHRTPSFEETCRLPRLALLCSFLWALLGSGAISAQTAHFSGTITTLGSGFASPYGLAVDGSGNVFVANDSVMNGVQESLAAGGYTTV